MEQYFKIGEISKLYNIGVDSLRYYEELGLIAPQRTQSGYRLYSIHDIWRLNVIRELRELGFTMEQIGRYLKEHSVCSTVTLLEEELKTLQEKMRSLQSLQENIEQRLKTIHLAGKRTMGKVEPVTYPPRRCYAIDESYSGDDEMDILIKRLLNVDKNRLYIIGSSQIGSSLSLAQAEKGIYKPYKSVFIVDKNGDRTLDGGQYLSVSYRGSCEQNRIYVPMLLDYARTNDLKISGDILEILWVDIHTSSLVEEQTIELQVRVENGQSGAE